MKKVLIVLLAVLFLLTGCEDEIIENPPINTLEANAGNDKQVETNQVLVLDGSNSKDENNGAFQYLWNIKSKPDNSTVILTDATTVSPKFTADKVGNYVVELKIQNGVFADTDEVSIIATEATETPISEPIILNQDINQERRLTNIFDDPAIPDYLVTADIHVTGHLIIDPSVTIAFDAGKAMYIDNPGTIIATGLGDNDMIFFTGNNKTPGYWKGLIINSSSTLNKLERVTIEYGGSNPANEIEVAANLGLSSQGNLHLTSSIIQHSAAYGMVVESGANWSADSFSNIFENNQTPLRIRASHVNSVDGQSYFANNTRNLIEVVGSTVFDLMEVQWGPALTSDTPVVTVPYLIKGKVDVKSGLRIRKGVELQFDSDSEFSVTPSGYLTAVGTSAEPIKFYGAEPNETGYWKGISIQSANENNELKYVEVYGAGSQPIDGFEQNAAIILDGERNAKLKIDHSKIGRSGGYGLYVENKAELTAFTFNKFGYNTKAAMALPANEVWKANNMVSIEFIGNGHNGIEIYGSVLLHPSKAESVWPALNFGATYLVAGNLSIQTGLKLMPGVALKFAEGKGIKVSGSGYLNAQGTDDLKIIFTGVSETKGFWNGIHFQTNSDFNILRNAVIEYAGKNDQSGVTAASIYVGENIVSKLNITQSIIAHGTGYGIAITTNLGTINSDFESVNQFEDLTLGNVYKTTN